MLSSDLQDILAACYRSTEACAKILFPQHFSLPFAPKIHGEMFNVLDNPALQRVVIMAPRGCGKSTTLFLPFAARHILFRDTHHLIPISCSEAQCIEQADTLKSELMDNELVRKLFAVGQGDPWSRDEWVVNVGTEFQCKVHPRGSGQKVRGLKFGRHRPHLVLCDDLEDDEAVMNEDRRNKLHNWFVSAVENSVDTAENWRIVVAGTMLHEDCLLVRLANTPGWTSLTLEACNEDLHSAWSAKYSDKLIREKYDAARKSGTLTVFYRELRNLLVPCEEATFSSSFFKYYSESDAEMQKRFATCEHVVICDPAKTVTPKSSDTAIVGLSFDYTNPAIFVRDVIATGLHPNEQYDAILSMCQRLHARTIGLEVNSLNEFVTYPLKNEMARRRVYYNVVTLPPRQDKLQRIKALGPFYRQGLVVHNDSGCCMKLEEQLVSFPYSKRLDAADALAYAIPMLEEGSRYFGASAANTKEQVEKEYEELKSTALPRLRSAAGYLF